MHNVQLQNLHFLQNIIGVIKSGTKGQGRWLASWSNRRSECMVLVEKPEGKGTLGRQRNRWDLGIK